MTFPEAISEALDQGWYLYSLGFEPASEGFTNRWHCTLRALSGPPRREISRGYGDEPEIAVCNALFAAPELEDEPTISNVHIETDLSALDALRKRFAPEPIKRRI